MPEWTLEEAKQHLNAWLAADIALAASKEYLMNGNRLTRANADEVKERITFWRSEVKRLESGRSGARVVRIVPRDM